MPEDIQLKFLRMVAGLENVDMVQPGKRSMIEHVDMILNHLIYRLWC